jgi:hypothetical protein
MATTYTLIGSPITVGLGGASSVSFTSIPATWTDLIVKVSGRTNYVGSADISAISFNGSSSSFNNRVLYGNGSSASSLSNSNNINGILFDGSLTTSNTFGNSEIYIPNYALSNYKSFSGDSVNENNALAYAYLTANLWSNTAAITSITIAPYNGSSFLQYSSFYLYGISNS